MAVIEINELKKDFSLKIKPQGFLPRMRSFFSAEEKTVSAVKGINLCVQAGEMVGFIGPNGAGKSTTIKMLTGILHPTSGKANVLGLTPWKDRQKLSYKIGTVFGQKSQLWLHLPPLDTFDLLARIYNLDWQKYTERKDELIEHFELASFINVPARKLSLGQRMRCEVAASLLHRPQVLFLDEPTIGLDPVAKSQIRELIRRANKEEGITVFLTSHDAGDIEKLCKRVVIVNFGEIIFDDSTNALRRNYLKTKDISLKLSAPWENHFNVDGVTVTKSKDMGVKLSVDTTKASIGQVVGSIIERNQVEDITIQNAPMEDIISTIYRQQRKDFL